MFSNFIPFSPLPVNNTTISHANDTYKLWHAQFGHAHASAIHRIMHHCNIVFSAIFCDSCILGKHHQLPFTDSHTFTRLLFNLFTLISRVHLPLLLLMALTITFLFLMYALNTHGFISYIINLKLLQFLNPLKSWLKTKLVLL